MDNTTDELSETFKLTTNKAMAILLNRDRENLLGGKEGIT